MKLTPSRLVLVDPHRSVLESLAERLDQEADFTIAGTAATGIEGLELALRTSPDLVLLETLFPERGAFDIVQSLLRQLKGTKTAFLTGIVTDVFLGQSIRLGLRGYLLKEEPVEDLLEHLRRIGAGEVRFSPRAERRLRYDPARRRFQVRSGAKLAALTPRQLEVFRYVANGHSVKEVAEAMELSEKSVDSHKYRIMRKLGVRDRVELARFAIREGLIFP